MYSEHYSFESTLVCKNRSWLCYRQINALAVLRFLKQNCLHFKFIIWKIIKACMKKVEKIKWN